MSVVRAVPFFIMMAIGVAGCGGDDASSSDAGVLALRALPNQLRYDKAQLTAPAGTVKIVMTNASSVPHDVDVEGDGVTADGAVVGQGKKSIVTADLKPGTYTFYCSVGGHRQAGMQGTLTVR